MTNPRQRRKTKSSTHAAISHSRRAKRLQKKMPVIRGPKALQDAWDSSKTLRQNYLALGLQHDLNPFPSGGSEISFGRLTDQNNTSRLHPTDLSSAIDDAGSSVSEGSTVASALPKGFGRIVRDSSGNVVNVELPSDEGGEHASKRELGIDVPVATTEPELRIWAHHETRQEVELGGKQDAIVQNLKNLAASAAACERHTSFGERSYLERLIKKYGNDHHRMARDRRLNPEQRTANELRRAIAKSRRFGVPCEGADTNVAE